MQPVGVCVQVTAEPSVCIPPLLPPCPERPPGAGACPTSGTVWWFLPSAEDQVFLERTAPS